MLSSSLLLPCTRVFSIGSSKLSMKGWTEDGTIIDLTYPEAVKNGMILDHIYGSPTHHGDGPKDLLQTHLLPGNETISYHPLQARRMVGSGVCCCKMHSEMLCASGIFLFLEAWLLLVEMHFCPFTHTSSFPRTVCRARL